MKTLLFIFLLFFTLNINNRDFIIKKDKTSLKYPYGITKLDSDSIEGMYIYLIKFKPFESQPSKAGQIKLDALGKKLRCKEELFSSYIISLSPMNSEQEYNKNHCIGIERYRYVVNYLEYKYKLNDFYFVYYDNLYAYKEVSADDDGITVSLLTKR